MCVRSVYAICLLLVIFTAVSDARATTCRIEDCPNFRAIRYYEELGCVRSDGSRECCPSLFDCSSLLTADKTKCHYKGRTFEPGEETGDGLEYRCQFSCMCQRDYGGEAAFSCPGSDCVLYSIPRDRESDCYMTTSLDECCPTGVRCVNDTESRRNFAQCSYEGKTFWEDQYIESSDSHCKKCVCQKGFDGTLDGPWCIRLTCEYTLYRTLSELGRCAPVFREGDNCCASRFHCPSPNDSVVSNTVSTTENEGDQCSFGDHKLNIGDELLVGTDGCLKCKCDVPPFLTCTRKSECDV